MPPVALNGSAQAFRIEAVPVDGLDEPITRAALLGHSAKSVDDLLANPTDREKPSRSNQAREHVLDILEQEGQQESDALDARVAAETGLAAKTVRNTRSDLSREGLIRANPDKDEYGAVKRWLVSRTGAPRT